MENITVDESEENRELRKIRIFLDFFEVFIEAFEQVPEVGVYIALYGDGIREYQVDDGILDERPELRVVERYLEEQERTVAGFDFSG